MASAMSFFGNKEEVNENEVKNLRKKEKEIQELIWYIISVNKNTQNNINEDTIEQINNEEAWNDNEYDSFGDFIDIFDTLEIKEVFNWKVEFKFSLFTEEYISQLPIDVFYDLMINNKLIDLSEKEKVKSNTGIVSETVSRIFEKS